MEDLKKRIVEISYKNRLSHLGSYFSSVGIIDEIYSKMKLDDKFILSSGHCALALYVVLEKYHNLNADKLFSDQGGHPHLDEKNKIYCSTGSLGMGLTVAVGRALANPDNSVYCLISDGECAEGSIWESLRYIKEQNIKNLYVFVNINGYCAYNSVDTEYLIHRLKSFLPQINLRFTSVNEFPFLRGLNAHYHIMSQDDYKLALELLNEKTI
jgi:transketolase